MIPLTRCLVAALAGLSGGCSSFSPHRESYPFTEAVLTPGMTVTANHPNGVIQITAGEDTTRTFSGPGWRKKRRLIARDTRWYGSLGLYDPAASFTASGRLLADEGRQFFHTKSEVFRYLYSGSLWDRPIYTNNGLVVGYSGVKVPGGEPVRSVTIWQVYIDGRRPASLRGADDSAISVSGGVIPETASPHPAPVGYERPRGAEEYDPRHLPSPHGNP